MKTKFKVGDFVKLNSNAMECKRSLFVYGIVQGVDNEIIKVQRVDSFGNKYRGHEQKWWHSGYWILTKK